MKKFYAKDWPGAKAYFSEADPSAQLNYSILSDEFDVRAKLWLLLFEHLIFSAGHMLESSLTYGWLKKNNVHIAELAFMDAIVLSLRDDRESLIDYAARRPINSSVPWRRNLTESILTHRAEMLDDIFDKAITWSPISESSWFKNSVITDLKRSQSLLRKRLIGIPKKNIEALCAQLEDIKLLRRRDFVSLVRKYCPSRESILLKYSDIFYHLSGALGKEAYPLLPYNESLLCCEKVSDETTQIREAPVTDLWREILSSWHLTASSLRSLSLSQIIDIRRDSLGKHVRDTWAQVIHRASESKHLDDALAKYLDASTTLTRELEREVQQQRLKHKRWDHQRKQIEVAVWATGGLGTALGIAAAGPVSSAVGLGAGILGFMTGNLILGEIEKRKRGIEFVLLSARIADI